MKLTGMFHSADRFKRNFARVASANIAAQLLLIAVTPILTRIYSPANFGVVAFFLAAMQIINAFSTFKVDWLIPNTVDREQAEHYFMAGLAALFVSILISLLAILFRDHWLAWWPGLASLGAYIWLVPVAAAGTGLHSMFQGWYVREGDLTTPSKVKIIQAVCNITASITLGLLISGPFGLIIGSFLGTVAGLVAMMKPTGNLLLRAIQPELLVMKRIYKKIHREALLATTVSLLNTLSTVAPVIALSIIYDKALIGVFAMVLRLVATPLGVISSALSQSFWSRAAELARKGEIRSLNKLYWKITGYLGCASVAVVAICLTAPLYIHVILGPDWKEAGAVLATLTPMLVGMLMFSATNHLIVLARQELQVIADISRLLLICLSVAVGARYNLEFTSTTALVAFSSLTGHILLFTAHIFVHRQRVGTASV